MAEPLHGLTRGLSGRPRKHARGWEATIKRICISKDAYSKWNEVKQERNLRNDDAVAEYLSIHDRLVAKFLLCLYTYFLSV